MVKDDPNDWECVQQGYAAWEAGEPFDKFQYEKWQEGWFVGFHGAQWKRLADACGARCSGFSYDNSATFVWPRGDTTEVHGSLLAHLRGVHKNALEQPQ